MLRSKLLEFHLDDAEADAVDVDEEAVSGFEDADACVDVSGTEVTMGAGRDACEPDEEGTDDEEAADDDGCDADDVDGMEVVDEDSPLL